MSQDPIFTKVGDILLEYLRGELIPTVLSSPDMIKLAYPGQEEEFRLGLFLGCFEGFFHMGVGFSV